MFLIKLSRNNRTNVLQKCIRSCTSSTKLEVENRSEFRVLNLKHVKNQTKTVRKQYQINILPPRSNQMEVDQEWSNVWPGPKTFHPASVPLPVRQGYNEKGAPPSKFGNAELMKIPNFLHLTPPAIKKHCEALKKFCNTWPENLTEEKCEEYFPLKVITSDYCHSSPTIRDPLARIVNIKLNLSSLSLDAHAKDKLCRLVGERFNEETNELTIVTDRCPTKKQNYDYAIYLLTAIFHESWTVEPWEAEKTEIDMKYYDWEKSASKCAVLDILTWGKDSSDSLENSKILNNLEVQEFKAAITELRNSEENNVVVDKYGSAVRKLLKLPNL